MVEKAGEQVIQLFSSSLFFCPLVKLEIGLGKGGKIRQTAELKEQTDKRQPCYACSLVAYFYSQIRLGLHKGSQL